MEVALLLEEFLADHSVEFEPLSAKEKWGLQQEWREHFAVGVKKATGKWVLGGIDWHAFSSGHTPSLSGFRAEVEYPKLDGSSFAIISSNEQVPTYKCRAQILPPLTALYSFIEQNRKILDLYIFSTDFRWTVVFTHEAQYGPYLAWSDREDDPEVTSIHNS